jgi:two-component system alkaline phosphatase synthesis response regulator PhoP
LEKTKILVVDDEPDTVSALRFRLEKAGYEVLTAEHGAAALDILRAQKVDVILADFMMPEVNGLELARLVKANPNWFETRVIMYSCNTDPEFRRRALEIGALDYLPKVDGYTNIIERLAEIAAPTRAAKARPAAQATAPEPAAHQPIEAAAGQPVEQAYREQLRALAGSLVDVLHLAGLHETLPDVTRYALGSAQRIAADIQKLSRPDQEEKKKEEDRIPHA